MRIFITPDRNFLQQVPESFGVYRFYSADGVVLYIGKAVNLNKRIKSYFKHKSGHSPRIALMVSKIASIELTLTDNETSALLLERNLIKSLKPRYNIIFRDDKSYPLIRISKHQYPLIESIRGNSSPGDLIFGPYPNAYALKETLSLLQRLFKLRTCKDTVFNHRARPCLLHQINLCCAPCVGKINPAEYQTLINYAQSFLQGNYSDLLSKLTQSMYHKAQQCEFEQAARLRDQIGLIKQLQEKQIISAEQTPLTADIVQYYLGEEQAIIYLIMVRNGLYIGDKHFIVPLGATEDLFEGFLENYYLLDRSCKQVFVLGAITPEFNDFMRKNHQIHISTVLPPRVRDLVKMGQRNVENIIKNTHGAAGYEAGVEKLSKLLHIKAIHRVECYDTSHNHGSSAVAAMVVYTKGKIDNTLYRRYNLSSTTNGDDLLALETVLRRRLAQTNLAVPEVIVVDGGIRQLERAKNLFMELGFCDKIKAIALFKGHGRKPELDSVMIDSNNTFKVADEPQLFKLLQALRDEAHRFAITGHRNQQIKRMEYSRLDAIFGIGATKRKALLAYFGSVENIAHASVIQLQQVTGVGPELAATIYAYFNA